MAYISAPAALNSGTSGNGKSMLPISILITVKGGWFNFLTQLFWIVKDRSHGLHFNLKDIGKTLALRVGYQSPKRNVIV